MTKRTTTATNKSFRPQQQYFEIPAVLVKGKPKFCAAKERPRFGSRGVYMSSEYREWQNKVMFALEQQKVAAFPEKFGLIFIFIGSIRADIDNAIGALLDVFVKSGLAIDDSQKYYIGSCCFIEPLFSIGPRGGKKQLNAEERLDRYHVKCYVMDEKKYKEVKNTLADLLESWQLPTNKRLFNSSEKLTK